MSAVQLPAEADGSLEEDPECPQLSLSVGRTYIGANMDDSMDYRWHYLMMDLLHEKWNVGELFTLNDIYRHEERLGASFPGNKAVRETIRATLQKLRDDGIIEFMDNRGTYKRLK